jgi:hypothetical protein
MVENIEELTRELESEPFSDSEIFTGRQSGTR